MLLKFPYQMRKEVIKDMADEIAQVMSIEMEGIKFAVKGFLEVGSYALRLLRALLNSARNKFENRSGNRKDYKKIIELSDGPIQIFNIRETEWEKVEKEAKKLGLYWCKCVDFVPGDGLKPIAVPAQFASAFAALQKSVAESSLVEDKKEMSEIEQQINECKEKLLAEQDPEKIHQLEVKIENLTQSQKEKQAWVDYNNGVISGEIKPMSLPEYLAQAKGTEFEKNPEAAVELYDKGVDIGEKKSAKELFQPIRSSDSIPKDSITFYDPKNEITVDRNFKMDDDGIVFSEYSFKTKNGELVAFSDKNMTKHEWNNTILPKLLDKAGILEGTALECYPSRNDLQIVTAYRDKLKSKAEKNIEKKLSEGKSVFSNAEAKNEVVNAISEQKKGFASASRNDGDIEFVCSPYALTKENGKLCFHLSDTETIMFGGTKDESVVNGNQCKFSIEKNQTVSLVSRDGKSSATTFISATEAANKVKEFAIKNSNVQTASASQTAKR